MAERKYKYIYLFKKRPVLKSQSRSRKLKSYHKKLSQKAWSSLPNKLRLIWIFGKSIFKKWARKKCDDLQKGQRDQDLRLTFRGWDFWLFRTRNIKVVILRSGDFYQSRKYPQNHNLKNRCLDIQNERS